MTSLSTWQLFLLPGNPKLQITLPLRIRLDKVTISWRSFRSQLTSSAPAHAEVVVAPPFVFLSLVKSLLRSDFAVAAQNAWVKKGGAFTGEIRYYFWVFCKDSNLPLH